MTASLRRLDFGLVSRDWSSFCVHNNAMYAAVYSGLVYRINPDGSDVVVVNQTRKWYKMVSAFGKIYATTNSDSADGVYEIDVFAGTATRVYTLANCYSITQFKKNLYISAITGYVRKLVPGAWTATSNGTSDAYRELSPSFDGLQLAACAARTYGNYGGLLHLYNPDTWARTDIGSDVRRSALILDENNYVTGLGILDTLNGLDGGYGSGDRPLSTTADSVTGLFNALRYNSSYYAAGWPNKIYHFLNWNRRPVEGFVAAVGAPQRSTSSALCATLDGLVVAASSEYSTASVLTSVDAGDTWTTRTTPDTVSPQQMLEVPVAGTVGYRLVCVGLGGIMTSDDRGNTWTVRSSAANFKCVCRDASDSALYACGYTGTESYTADSVIYKSTDNGSTWTSNFSAVAGGMISGIAYNTDTGALVAVTVYGSNVVYVSTNHGTSWSASTTPQKQYWRGILFDRHRKVLLAWTATLGDGAAYTMRSADSGSTWTYDSTAIGFNDIVFEPGGRLLGCLTDAVYAADNGKDFFLLPGVAAGSWSKLAYSAYYDAVVACAEAGTARFMTSASSRKTPRRIWWSYDTVPVRNFKHGILSTPSGRILVTATEYTTTSILYSDNVGLTWTAATTPDTMAPTSMLLVPHTNTLGYRLVAVAETAAGSSPAIHSDDNGSTWTIASLSGIRGLRSLCRHGVTGYLFAAGYSGTDTTDTATTEVLRSTDNGATWTSVYTNAGGGVGSKIVYDPLRNSLCVVTENGAAHSIVSFDAGDTWTAHTGSARRAWRDMIWDRARGCLVKVCSEDTVSVLGETYTTVVMPGGRQWSVENARNTGLGTESTYGTKMTLASVSSFDTALSGAAGWRCATDDDYDSLLTAVPGGTRVALVGQTVASDGTYIPYTHYYGGVALPLARMLRASTGWTPAYLGTDIYNFSLFPEGDGVTAHIRMWAAGSLSGSVGTTYGFADVSNSVLLDTSAPATDSRYVRLVRDTPSAYASTDNMYRSFDGGVTWEVVPGSRPAFGISADMSGRLFTVGDSSVRRSDNGLDWRDVDSEAGSTWRRAFFSAHLDKIVACGHRGLSRFLLTGNT